MFKTLFLLKVQFVGTLHPLTLLKNCGFSKFFILFTFIHLYVDLHLMLATLGNKKSKEILGLNKYGPCNFFTFLTNKT